MEWFCVKLGINAFLLKLIYLQISINRQLHEKHFFGHVILPKSLLRFRSLKTRVFPLISFEFLSHHNKLVSSYGTGPVEEGRVLLRAIRAKDHDCFLK